MVVKMRQQNQTRAHHRLATLESEHRFHTDFGASSSQKSIPTADGTTTANNVLLG
jgi:hypothetical protein